MSKIAHNTPASARFPTRAMNSSALLHFKFIILHFTFKLFFTFDLSNQITSCRSFPNERSL